MKIIPWACALPLAAAAICLPRACALAGQTDEIQVYDATIADPGQLDVEFHNNYTPMGGKAADFPQGYPARHSLNGVPEFAYGVTDWFEAGLYLPVYSLESNGRAELDSAKIRALFVTPWAAQRTVFYGINFELSYNAAHWEPTRFSGEIRPIVGVHLAAWDFILNPIFDTGFTGVNRLDFAPAGRVAYNLSPAWAVALEHYADLGAVGGFDSPSAQGQMLFAVVDYKQEDVGSIEAGIGHGLTAVSNDLTIKLIVGRDF